MQRVSDSLATRRAAAPGTTQHSTATPLNSPRSRLGIFPPFFSFSHAVKKKWGSLMPNNYAGHLA
jgi:hypothetical protein